MVDELKDLIFVESRTARQQMIDKCSILDKVKTLPYLTNDRKSSILNVVVKQMIPFATSFL